jgi:hypothetical protein
MLNPLWTKSRICSWRDGSIKPFKMPVASSYATVHTTLFMPFKPLWCQLVLRHYLDNLRMRPEEVGKSKHASVSECKRTASIVEIICLFVCTNDVTLTHIRHDVFGNVTPLMTWRTPTLYAAERFRLSVSLHGYTGIYRVRIGSSPRFTNW